MPISVENEANLAALAEQWLGAGRDVPSFICVFGEVGVGAGIVIDGELFRGAHGFGGEFGHMTVDRDGAVCACGSNGCLETLVGQEAIARRAGVARRDGRPYPAASPRSSCGGREQGDEAVLRSLAEAGTIARHRPRIGGEPARRRRRRARWVFRAAGAMAARERCRAALDTRVLSARWTRCEVRASPLGEGAAVRGAAALTLRNVLAAPWLVAGRRLSMQEAVV